MRKKELSHINHQAIRELISPGNKSLNEVAIKVGVTSRTIRNWNRNPQFQEALAEAMDELRKNAISASAFSVQIEAMTNMVDYELKIIEDFDIKGAVLQLGENQTLIERKIKEISEEMKLLQSVLQELRKELVNSGN